ncbi:hypothetical protein NE865_08037 [Phthorimaea operculella]|nr:hypothetical protein NE865_08037 [Phthorimaea operculella]
MMKSVSMLDKGPSSVVIFSAPTKKILKKQRDETILVSIQKYDRRLIAGISFFIIVQCIVVFVTASTINNCMWSPDLFGNQIVKVIMVMYLFDYQKCGYGLKKTKGIRNIDFNRNFDARGFNLKSIQWSALVKSSSIRLTQSVQLHMNVSIGLHSVWIIIAIATMLFCHLKVNFKFLKNVISVFMYMCIFMVIFDISMGTVYLAHIQQSLTLAMVLRHAGWAVEMKVDNPEQFAGWIPMLASIMWLRCIVFLIVNILFIKKIWKIKKKIRKKEVQRKHRTKNAPIPDSFNRIEDDSEKTYVVHAL